MSELKLTKDGMTKFVSSERNIKLLKSLGWKEDKPKKKATKKAK
jgi:hypothetical protein